MTIKCIVHVAALTVLVLSETGVYGQCNEAKMSSKLQKLQHMAEVMDPLSVILVSTFTICVCVHITFYGDIVCCYLLVVLWDFCLQRDGYFPALSHQAKARETYKLWEHLGALKPEEERVNSMMTLSSVERLPQLSAIKTILGKLVEPANTLVSYIEETRHYDCVFSSLTLSSQMETNYGVDHSDNSLLHLMVEIDIFNNLQSGLKSIKNIMNFRNVLYDGEISSNHNLWLIDLARCLLSTGEGRCSLSMN